MSQTFLKNYFGDLSTQVSPLMGDASSRIYEKVQTGSTSFVLCRREPFKVESDPQISISSFLREQGIPTPQILSLEPEAGMILQEDLGQTHLEDAWKASVDPALYDEALSIIFRMQKSVKNSANCFAFTYRFDVEKFVWEFEYAQRHVFESHAGIQFSDPELSGLKKEFTVIAEYLVAQPNVFTHRDYHSRNLMMDCRNHHLSVIDYQDARLGPGTYDLVSLVYDSYVTLPSALGERLLDAYFQENKSRYEGSTQKFKLELAHQKVQRCLKACGSFAGLFYLKKKDRYLGYLPETLQTVITSLDELEALQSLRFPILRSSLQQSIVRSRKVSNA